LADITDVIQSISRLSNNTAWTGLGQKLFKTPATDNRIEMESPYSGQHSPRGRRKTSQDVNVYNVVSRLYNVSLPRNKSLGDWPPGGARISHVTLPCLAPLHSASHQSANQSVTPQDPIEATSPRTKSPAVASLTQTMNHFRIVIIIFLL